jgi:hypothetical protein
MIPSGVGGIALGKPKVAAPQRVGQVAAAVAVDQPGEQRAAGSLASLGAPGEQAAHGGHGDVGNHDRAHGRAAFHVVADVAAAAGLAGGPVDRHALAGQVYVAYRHGNGLSPAQAGEREDDHHVAQAQLEVIHGLRQAKHLRNGRDDHPAAHRGTPAGTKLQGRVGRDDSLLPRPGE